MPALAWLFGSTMFLAAFLLFSVQPMIGKMVLPVLGGTPGVWNTCLVFYQAILLAAYACAHLFSRWTFRKQFAVHSLLLLIGFLVLPITIPADAQPPSSGDLAIPFWLLSALTFSAGLPLFVVGATAPLLQRWFFLSGHPRGDDPYFLYAASNAGSLAGLFCYPWIIESRLTLARQSQVWEIGFTVLGALLLACGYVVHKSRSTGCRPRLHDVSPCKTQPPTPREMGQWVLLAFIPSSWLLGVTTYITTDLAAIPLLWTLPLGIYLLTYILAFADTPRWGLEAAVACLPLVIVPLVLVLASGFVQLFWIPLHLLAFLVGAMVCHGRLARTRPDAKNITVFYLAVALGGVLGGLFNSLLAPLIFDRLFEYPFAVLLACLVSPGVARPAEASRIRFQTADLALPLSVSGLLATMLLNSVDLGNSMPGMLGVTVASGLGLYSCVTGLKRPLRFALTVAGVLLAAGLARSPGGQVIHRERDFFGTLRVLYDPKDNVHRLVSGSTLHGEQSLDPITRDEPTTYFARTGPIGQVFASLETVLTKETGAGVGIIGLGAGTLAAYARPGQRWTFFEIDPAVQRIARDRRFFTYLADAQARGVDTLAWFAGSSMTSA
jgi:hypothetical protein